ncbi:rab5 GDP/GTP exchange factor isoform X2 [Amyelois transitella]|nr:rab5 GDP/GTP exchange factor isoform X2 [Amyelois transitella]
MNFASKMPLLRFEQSDLKCKNGCDYFGNPQWQGYCSKCHREQMSRQRRAEKASSATLPKPEQKKEGREGERNLKVTARSSFSKFEEKRLRQSETLKKANLLKSLQVFKKTSTDDHEPSEKRPAEFQVPPAVLEGMKRDFRTRFPRLSQQIDRDCRMCVHTLILDVIKYANVMTADELSERVQRHYQRFLKHMDTAVHFNNVDADVKENIMDFVEKHAMSYLHELPSVVFSPTGTDDERLDRAMSERIQQLSWVGEAHLECKLDRNSATCRQLLYKAISELLGMDSAMSPGGKLRQVRRCCRHVLALCGAPASADDLLPALIFTVLKANPPRLVSNINFVTRFCNAQRLMTGEGGYYFTNLCCAVSFIENMTAESLNMDKKEFDCYMAMPASIGGSSWAAALSLYGASREAEEQRAFAEMLLEKARQVQTNCERFASDAKYFEEEIAKKVKHVLEKTPLKIKPRTELPRIGKLKELSSMPLIDLGSPLVETRDESRDNQSESTDEFEIQKIQPVQTAANLEPQNIIEKTEQAETTDEIEPKLNILGFEVVEKPSPPKTPHHELSWDMKQTNSLELLTPSPLGYTPFDSRSIDEILTPDEFGTDHLAPGLSNINYDIDLSDLSGDNSIADDLPKEPKDPFSPDDLKKPFDPFAPRPQTFNAILEKFDEFSLVDAKSSTTSDPFEVVHRTPDPFSPVVPAKAPQAPVRDPFSPDHKESTSFILDDSNSPTAACLLPSPLQPQNSGK